MERFERIGKEAGLGEPDGRCVVLDGRYVLIEPSTLMDLSSCSDGTTLIGPDGQVIATTGPDGQTLCAGSPTRRLKESDPQAQRVENPWSATQLSQQAMLRRIERWVHEGVHFMDPSSTWIGPRVSLEPGAVIWGHTVLRGTTHVEAQAEIQERTSLDHTRVCRGSVVRPGTVAEHAHIGPGSRVGPMAHLRSGTWLEGNNRVGNFVETKKARFAVASKASHLSYLGDVCVGEGANVGAGTITCNYDGWGKHETTIGARAFIGSNSCLVAPVSIGSDSIVGAGSVICSDVPENTLAVARGEQKNLKDAASKIHQRNRARAASASREEPDE
jgi:UDP-N-acetylglucosamine diphosphorylase/glucosamine-1-phosphate N-acetyltransferase